MTTFKAEEEARREQKAIDFFIQIFSGSYQKLGHPDIGFKIFDKSKTPIAYAEVIPRMKSIRDAYPVSIHAKKLTRLIDKRMSPVIIWSCDDGIIYVRADKITGDILIDKSGELVVMYDKQKPFKYVRFS